ncbi:hypothetical protein Chor_010556 [Crotalus horridus]
MLHFTALAENRPAMGATCFDLPSFSVMPLGRYGVSLGGGEHMAHFSLWHVAHPPALSLVSSQPLVGAPQEGTESLGCQSPACALQLAQGQLLLAQHTEVQAELSQWLEEARQAVAAFSPGSITTRCEVFQEQQEVLEGLREAIAEHRPLVGKLHRITRWLSEQCPQEAAPFWQRLQATEEQYSSLREQAQQATAVLRKALPRYSQLSERLELVTRNLERVRDHTRHPPELRGDPIWLQEQLWENSRRLAELEKLGVALETLSGQGAEFQATLQTTTPPAMQERMQELRSQWQLLWELEEDREASVQELLALAGRFWPGLAELAGALSNSQQMVLDLEDSAASGPKDIQAKLVAMQALREEVDALQSELDSLGAWGMELISLCGDLEKPTVTKSLDDVSTNWAGKRWSGGRQQHGAHRVLQDICPFPLSWCWSNQGAKIGGPWTGYSRDVMDLHL